MKVMAAFAGAASLALMAFSSFAAASIHIDSDCHIDSDYSLNIQPSRLVFTQKDKSPHEVIMASGTLQVDGSIVALDAADRQRIADFELGVRDLVPEAKEIARDAVGIAFDAVNEVSAAFAKNPADARAHAVRLQRASMELQRRIEATDNMHGDEFGKLVASAVEAMIPELVGNIVGQALTVAFTGNEAAAAELEARADGIEKSVDRIVERRSKELEKRVDALCPRVHDIARLQTDLDARLPDGSRLNLFHD